LRPYNYGFTGAAIGGVRVIDGDLRQDRLEGVDSDFATLTRTVVILCAIAGFVHYTGKWRALSSLISKNWSFITLSGLATGASCVAIFAPCSKR